MKSFSYVCHRCAQEAALKGEPYKGVVNLDVRPIFMGVAMISHECFTCGTKEIVKLMNKPKSIEEFRKQVKKQTGRKTKQ